MDNDRSFPPLSMPTEIPETVKTIKISKCVFCDPTIVQRQLVYKYKGILVLYNIRKGEKPGCCFLILPERHNYRAYGLSPEEIDTIHTVRRALVEVVRESHPDSEVIVYVQETSPVGKTVFHHHEQLVAVNRETIPLYWTLMSLHPTGSVSAEEMLKVRGEFHAKMQAKTPRRVFRGARGFMSLPK